MATLARAHHDVDLMQNVAVGMGAHCSRLEFVIHTAGTSFLAIAGSHSCACYRAAEIIPQGFPSSIGALGGLEDSASAVSAVEAFEAELTAAHRADVDDWEALVDAAIASNDLCIPRLKELVELGASAHNVNLKYIYRGGGMSRLAELVETLRVGSLWHERCLADVSKPQTASALKELLAEGESIPLHLTEVEEVRMKVQRVNTWLDATVKLMGSRCELRELQELLREAETLRIKMPEVDALRTRTLACRKWTNQIHNELLRRTSSRKTVGVKLTVAEVEGLLREAKELNLEAVEIMQACEKVEEARRWSSDAAGLLSPPLPVSPSVLGQLDELASRAEELNLQLAEQEALDKRLGHVRDWLTRAKAAMESHAEWKVLTRLVKEAKATSIELPEVKLVAEQQAEQAWLGQAELALTGPATVEDLTELVSQSAGTAERSNSPRAAEIAKALAAKLEKASMWEERFRRELEERPSVRDATVLCTEAEGDGVLLPEIEKLRAGIAAAKAWLEQGRRSQARSTRGVASRASLEEVWVLYRTGQDLLLALPEVNALAAQLQEAEDWSRRAEAALAEADAEAPDKHDAEDAKPQAADDSVASLNGKAAEESQPRPSTSGRRRAAATGSKALLDRFRELIAQSDALSVFVGLSSTLRLRSWRQEASSARSQEGGGLLSELSALLSQGRALGLHEQADEPSQSAARGDGIGDKAAHGVGADADGVKLEAAAEQPPVRTSARGSARSATGESRGAKSEGVDEPDAAKAEGKQDESGALAVDGGGPSSNTVLAAAATAKVHDGARGGNEWAAAAAEWHELEGVLQEAEEWKTRADRVLTTEKVELSEMRALIEQGSQLCVTMEEQDMLERMADEAEAWIAQADALARPDATLEGLQKCVKQYSKINLLSERVGALHERASQGQQWLEDVKNMFKQSSIQLASVQLILQTDGEPLYCVCRQPDDLQRLMICCDGCEIWFHINCLGISPAKSKVLTSNGADFHCPACCAKQGIKFGFEPRVSKPLVKRLPSMARTLDHLRRADALTVRIEEAEMLRAALRRASEWQATTLPPLLRAHGRGRTGAQAGGNWCIGGGGLTDEELARWLDEGECFRVECDLYALLKGWQWARQLRPPAGGDGVLTGAAARLPLEALEGLLAAARSGSVSSAIEESLNTAKPSGKRVGGGVGMAAAASAVTSAVMSASAAAARAAATLPPEDVGGSAAGSKEAGDIAGGEGGDGAEQADSPAPAPVPVWQPSWSEWLTLESSAVCAEVRLAAEQLSEAKMWEEEAAQCMDGQAASDPTRLQGLISRGEALGVTLPSLRALREHSSRVVSWGQQAQAVLDATASTGSAGPRIQLPRPAVHELLRVQREGANLCASGSVWRAVLGKLASAATSLESVQHTIVHYTGPAALGDAIHALEACGVVFDEGAVLRAHLGKLLAEHAPPSANAHLVTVGACQMTEPPTQLPFRSDGSVALPTALQSGVGVAEPSVVAVAAPGTIDRATAGAVPAIMSAPTASIASGQAAVTISDAFLVANETLPPSEPSPRVAALFCPEPPVALLAPHTVLPPPQPPNINMMYQHRAPQPASAQLSFFSHLKQVTAGPPVAATIACTECATTCSGAAGASSAAHAHAYDAVATSGERAPSTGLHGLSRKQAIGARIRVYYNEDGASVPYGGVVESLDVKRGLRVRLDGYSKREWVTDDDEWEWAEGPLGAPGPRPVEFVIGAQPFREILTRLAKSAEVCRTAAKGEHTPGTGAAPASKGKRGAKASAAAGSGQAAKRPRKEATTAGAQPVASSSTSARKRKAAEAAHPAASEISLCPPCASHSAETQGNVLASTATLMPFPVPYAGMGQQAATATLSTGTSFSTSASLSTSASQAGVEASSL